MSQRWSVRAFRAVEDGVVVDGSFGGEEMTLLFDVVAGPAGITAVSRPSELRDVPVAPGSSEQSVLEAIRLFFDVSTVRGGLESDG